MTHNSAEWPPLDEYEVGPEILGFGFKYPAEYLECIAWGDRDFDAGGDGHALAFLVKSEVATDLRVFVRKATSMNLVPFARGDNGDALFCFDGQGGVEIFVINLGEDPLRARSTGCTDFVTFINDYRSGMDLPHWRPGGK
jgi:hypothetical protein